MSTDAMATLARIEKKLDALLTRSAAAPPAAPASNGARVASDGDLDGPHGNPEVRKDPNRWKGASFVGARFSECPADYLDAIAEMNDWRAKMLDEEGAKGIKQANGKPRDGFYPRLDAARARGWAARRRASGEEAPPPPAPPPDTSDEDIPF